MRIEGVGIEATSLRNLSAVKQRTCNKAEWMWSSQVLQIDHALVNHAVICGGLPPDLWKTARELIRTQVEIAQVAQRAPIPWQGATQGIIADIHHHEVGVVCPAGRHSSCTKGLD